MVIVLKKGDKVKLAAQKQQWTVRGVTERGRFAILTKPFNLKHTVLYTVIDFERGVRGRDNCHGLGYETDEQIADALEAFQATEDDLSGQRAHLAAERGETSWPSVFSAEVSHRTANYLNLDIVSVNGKPVRES